MSVPKGWQDITLVDVIELQRGYDLPTVDRTPGIFRVIGGGGPNGTHHVHKVDGPGVVIGRSGSGFGRAWWSEEDFWALNTGMFVKNFRGNDPKFVYYLLDSIDFSSYNSGGAQPSLNRNFIYPIPVALPPLPEQRKIAEILRTWDDAIVKVDSLRRIRLATVEAEQLRMLFPDTSDEVDRKRQESWIRVPLGDAFTERSESGFESGTLLSISQVAGVVAQDSVGRKDTSNGSRSKYKRVVPGDIAYNTMRMWQGAAGLSSLEGLVSPAYTVVSPVLELIEPKFAAQLFKTKKMMFLFQRHSQGLTSDTWNLKYPAFSKIEIELPALEEQRRISAYLDTVRMEISLLEKQKFALEIQKRGLMQQLLTGKLRVNVDEGEAASA